jgi:hypothetical protein
MSAPAAAPRRLATAATGRVSILLPAGVFAATVALRLIHLDRAYDVFLDETIYSRIAAGAASDWRVVFGAYPFYLHSPLSFYLQAFVIDLFGIGGTAIHVVYSLRVFNVIVAGGVAVLIFAVVSDVSSRRWGLLAGALFAFDPFIISFDSRLFLETLAMFWVLLGYLLLLPLAGEGVAVAGSPGRSARLRALAGGFSFGLALLTKETSAALYILPLLWCLWRARPLRRSVAGTALATLIVTYLPYPIIAAATGGASEFVNQKFSGIERLLGIVQATGFNRPSAPSLLSRVSADLGTFVVTYVLIGLGGLATIWLYRRGSPKQRLIATWGFGAFVMLAFQTTQGTIEEQMFYYLVVPSIVLVATALSLLSMGRLNSRTARALLLASLVAVGGFDVVTWVGAHMRHDTALASAVGWMERHVPAGSRVAPLVDGTQFVLPSYRLLFNPEAGDVSPGQLQAADTQFVLTSSLQAEQGYSAASPALLGWLDQHAQRRFAATGATAGTVVIWQLAVPLPRTAPPGPVTLSPRAPISVGAPTYRD